MTSRSRPPPLPPNLRDPFIGNAPSLLSFLNPLCKSLSLLALDVESGNLSSRVLKLLFDKPPQALSFWICDVIPGNGCSDDSDELGTIIWSDTLSPENPLGAPTPFLRFSCRNTYPQTPANTQKLSPAFDIQNVPNWSMLVNLVACLREILSSLGSENFRAEFCEVFQQTTTILSKLLAPATTATSTSRTKTMIFHGEWRRESIKEYYPTIIDIIDTIAALDAKLFQNSKREGATPFANLQMSNGKFAKVSVDLGQEVDHNFCSPTSDGVAHLVVDTSVYMSRWASLSLKCPQLNMIIAHKTLSQSCEIDAEFTVTFQSVKNNGGVLNSVLPLKRLSKYLTENFKMSIKLAKDGSLSVKTEFLFPRLPRWLMSIFRVFIKKVSGTYILLMKDIVSMFRDDILTLRVD